MMTETGKAVEVKFSRSTRILFVDDRAKRIKWAIQNYPSPDFDLEIAPNVKEALRLLSAQDWDLVSLDHDLTGIDFEDPETPTCGMEIVRYISKTGWPEGRKRPEFIIHSSNLFATHLMTVALQNLGFSVHYWPVNYPRNNMQYDEKGNPK